MVINKNYKKNYCSNLFSIFLKIIIMQIIFKKIKIKDKNAGSIYHYLNSYFYERSCN
jgi:hypothetical protein